MRSNRLWVPNPRHPTPVDPLAICRGCHSVIPLGWPCMHGALQFTRASDQYAQADVAPVIAPPFTIMARVRPASTGSLLSVVWLGDKDVASDAWIISIDDVSGNNRMKFTIESSGETNQVLVPPVNLSANEWATLAAVEAASDDHRAFVNGANKVTNTETVTPNGTDRIAIGRDADSTPGNTMDGRICDVVIYNSALSDDVILGFHGGASPHSIQGLIGSWMLLDTTDPTPDLSGKGNHLTLFNTPTQADHAPTGLPFAFDLGWEQAAGGSGPSPQGRTKGITRRRSGTLLAAAQRDDADGNPTEEYLLLRTDQFGRTRVRP